MWVCEDSGSDLLCPCEGVLVNKGALCPANMVFLRILGSKTLWGMLPCSCRNWLRTRRQWDRLPREAVQSSFLDIFKTHLGKDLSNMFWSCNWCCFEQEIGLEPPEAPPSLNYIVILWLHCGEEGLLLLCAVRCPWTSGPYSTSAIPNLCSYQEKLENKNVTDAMTVGYVVNTKNSCSYSPPWRRLYFFHDSTQRHQAELCQTSEERADF